MVRIATKSCQRPELASTADTPDSIVYQVLTLDGDSMTVTAETGPGVWWTFRLARVPESPVAGKWKLDGITAGVGPSAGSTEWWASEADRPCWYDDIYEFGADGSLRMFMATRLGLRDGKVVQTVVPRLLLHMMVALTPYIPMMRTLRLSPLMGKGAYLALKAVNGQELASTADTPDSITYQVLTLDGDSMSVTVETAKQLEFGEFLILSAYLHRR